MKYLIFIALVFAGCHVFSQPESSALNFEGPLQDIVVRGNSKTSKNVILNELDIQINKPTNGTAILDGISRVRNTNLFSKVSYNINFNESGNTLEITVAERWTTIPIFKLSSGGGVEQITLGVYDPNLYGKYLEMGGQYERLGDANSGVAWFKNPQFFGKKNAIDFQYWKTNRLRTKYIQEEDEPVIKTGFLHSRDKLFLGYNRRFSNRLVGHIFYEYNNDSFSENLLSDEVKAITAITGLPIDTKVHFIGLGLDIGRLNFNSYLVDGLAFNLSVRHGLTKTDNADDFWHGDLGLYYFKTIFNNSTFAQRFLSGLTSTKILQYWNYLGGLDRIRGFSDNRFAGRYFWLSNTELRVPVFERSWVVAQAVGFFDVTSAVERFKDLSGVDGISAGGGVRFFLPKIYRFVVRFDYAVPLKKEDDMSFSFGVQQFF